MVAGGLVTAASHGFALAVSGRLLSGVGAVLMNILLAKMVADWFAEGELTTAMAIMLSSWPVGLGLAAATLGGGAPASWWRRAVATAAVAAALGLVLIAFAYRDPPRTQGSAAGPPARRARLPRREVGLALSAGFAWGCFNASLVAVVAFGPAMLVARGVSLGDAGFIVSLAIWVTILSVPLGGVLTDRLGRPTLVIVAGSVAAGLATLLLPVLPHPLLAFSLLGFLTGAAPGAVMALLPKTVAPERLATAFGVYYTVFYVVMALTQLAAGVVRDVVGSPAAPSSPRSSWPRRSSGSRSFASPSARRPARMRAPRAQRDVSNDGVGITMYVTMYGQRRRCGYATNDSQAGVHRAPPEPSAQGTRPQVPRHGSRSDPSGHRPRSRADGNAGSRHRGVEADRALHRPATVATSAPRPADGEAGRGP